MASGINFGIKKSIPHFLGICLGFPIMVLAVGLGLGAIFIKFPSFQHAIKIIGIIYMLYLSWKVATAHTNIENKKKTKPLSFIQAALFQWVNPKAWVMAVAAISAYSSLSSNIFYEALIIAIIFFLACFPCIGVWLFFGATLKKKLKNPKIERLLNYSMGGLLFLSILLIFFE